MRRNTSKAAWFLFTTLLSIFSISTIRIFDGFNWPFYAVTANAVISLGGLIFQLHVEDRVQKRPVVRAMYIVLIVDSVSVFLMLGLSLFILTSQYHNPQIPDAHPDTAAEAESLLAGSGRDLLLCETDDLYVYLPDYDEIDFVAGERPSREDESILLCVAAAFQHTYQLDFRHDNIVGWHTADGQLERGKPQSRLGAFTWADGEARIWNIDEAEDAVRNAAERGGSGYQQFVVLCGGERGGHTSNEFRCYRVLALLDGRACIIDSRTQMHYDDFIGALERLDVRDALYCDMGSGWNYSWYRDAGGKAVDMIGTPWPFSHNWLVFRKNSVQPGR